MDNSFVTARRRHLTSISAREIDGFAATVARLADVRLIGPDGTVIVGYESAIEAHRGWFDGSPFTFEPTQHHSPYLLSSANDAAA